MTTANDSACSDGGKISLCVIASFIISLMFIYYVVKDFSFDFEVRSCSFVTPKIDVLTVLAMVVVSLILYAACIFSEKTRE